MFPAQTFFLLDSAPKKTWVQRRSFARKSLRRKEFAILEERLLRCSAMVWLQIVLVAAFVSFAALLSLAAWRARSLSARADRLFPSLDQGKPTA